MITVTKPFIPPLDEFQPYLEHIWESGQLTNDGIFHQQLEQKLADYLGVNYVSLFANGTLALVIALQTLNIIGEVITTPFSFVASTHSIWWNNIKPVFVDIEHSYCNINPEKIESAITPQTTAILAVHVYGNPCNVYEIQKIAKNYGLKVIYDACHTFGVTLNDIPILNFGDISVMSFHATKLFNTFEGGAIICHDKETKQKIDDLKNFGFRDETIVVDHGINAKMNEIQAAMGLLQLKYVEINIEKRRQITLNYRELLSNIKGIRLLNDMHRVKHCYSYFPIFVDDSIYGISRDELYEKLKKNNIYCRRYFYPLISQFPVYKNLESAQAENLKIAEQITKEVICLPLYPELKTDTIKFICSIIQKQ